MTKYSACLLVFIGMLLVSNTLAFKAFKLAPNAQLKPKNIVNDAVAKASDTTGGVKGVGGSIPKQNLNVNGKECGEKILEAEESEKSSACKNEKNVAYVTTPSQGTVATPPCQGTVVTPPCQGTIVTPPLTTCVQPEAKKCEAETEEVHENQEEEGESTLGEGQETCTQPGNLEAACGNVGSCQPVIGEGIGDQGCQAIPVVSSEGCVGLAAPYQTAVAGGCSQSSYSSIGVAGNCVGGGYPLVGVGSYLGGFAGYPVGGCGVGYPLNSYYGGYGYPGYYGRGYYGGCGVGGGLPLVAGGGCGVGFPAYNGVFAGRGGRWI